MASRARHSCGGKWEKPANLFRARLAPILGDLESLKVLSVNRPRTVMLYKLLTPFLSGVRAARGPAANHFFRSMGSFGT